MDHEELHRKIQEDLSKVKDAILDKLDDYQHRVTKLETHQGWHKKLIIWLGAGFGSMMLYLLKIFITKMI